MWIYERGAQTKFLTVQTSAASQLAWMPISSRPAELASERELGSRNFFEADVEARELSCHRHRIYHLPPSTSPVRPCHFFLLVALYLLLIIHLFSTWLPQAQFLRESLSQISRHQHLHHQYGNGYRHGRPRIRPSSTQLLE